MTFAVLSMAAFATCAYDSTVNSGSYSVISCSNMTPLAKCYATFTSANQSVVVPDDLSFNYMFGYPSDFSGNVVINYAVNTNFEFAQTYNTSVRCVNDNATSLSNVGMITIEQPRTPSAFAMIMLWTKDNVNYLLGGLFFAFIIMIIAGLYWDTLRSVIGG